MACRFFSCVVLIMPGGVFAQSAMLRVSHNDPDGIVEPGQTVRLEATLSWQNATVLWDVRGGVRATGDLGTAADPQFPYIVESLPSRIIAPGTPAGGSVEDVWIFNGDSGFLAGWNPALPPWTSAAGVVVTRFDWTAPSTLGQVDFAWEQDTVKPLPVMFLTQSPFSGPFNVPTTFIGTSLTVVPGVGSGVVLAAGLGVMGRRRR